MFPFADPNQQMPSSLSMDHSQGYTTLDGPLNGSGREPLNDHQAYYGQGMGNIEDGGDAARGPRLSQEQLAYLEGEFALHYKPSTDHKKALAERMGVEFAKVNVRLQTLCIRSLIDHHHRIGSRIDELKRSLNPRLSKDRIDQLTTQARCMRRRLRVTELSQMPSRPITTLPRSRVLSCPTTWYLLRTSRALSLHRSTMPSLAPSPPTKGMSLP